MPSLAMPDNLHFHAAVRRQSQLLETKHCANVEMPLAFIKESDTNRRPRSGWF